MIKIVAVLYTLFICIATTSFGQSRTITPPYLKTRHEPGIALYAGYRQLRDSATVITNKFKISETGFLDALSISPNAPAGYFDSIRKQLMALNGYWEPQLKEGRPEKSKWLIYRYYVMGPAGRDARSWLAVKEAYKRDYELFRCLHIPGQLTQCLTLYIEGPNFFLFPPEWYETNH